MNPALAMLLWFGVPAVVAFVFLGGVGVGLRLAVVAEEKSEAARIQERIRRGEIAVAPSCEEVWPDDDAWGSQEEREELFNAVANIGRMKLAGIAVAFPSTSKDLRESKRTRRGETELKMAWPDEMTRSDDHTEGF